MAEDVKTIGGMTEQEYTDLTTSLVVNTIEKQWKEKGWDKLDVKYLVDPTKAEAEQLKKSGYERFNTLLKGIVSKDMSEYRVKAADPNVSNVDASGGYLVPEVTRAEIMRLIPTFGQARQYFNIIPMGKADTVNMPKKNASVSIGAVSQGADIASSKPTLATFQLAAKKLGGIAVMSNELLGDSIVNFQNYVTQLFAEELAIKEDDEFFAGDGTNFTGVFSADHTYGKEVSIASGTGMTYDDLIDAAYGLDQRYLRDGAWYMHRTVLAEVRKIVDNEGLPVFVPASNDTPASLLGYPIRLIESAPTAAHVTVGLPYILLGNFRNSYIGDKGMISLALSTDATVDSTSLFQADLSAIRIIERIAFNAGMVEGYSSVVKGA